MNAAYLDGARKQFEYYKLLGEKAIGQVPDEGLFWQFIAESNSIAIIVQHMAGNMLSRWTDFLHSDGEKAWRKRDEEFEPAIATRDELMRCWREGWDCVFNALDSITEDDLGREIFIRNQGLTVVDAITRQLAHYSYHVGQIVYIARMVSGAKWESLSIPKHASGAYNQEKFSKPKHTEHFTEEWLKKNNESK